MASSSTAQSKRTTVATPSAKKTNERWSDKDYMVVKVLVDEYLEKHGDIKQHHLSAIFAEVCPHKKEYLSNRLYEHKTTSKSPTVAKGKQRAWRQNDFADIPYPGPDYQLTVEIKDAINNSPTYQAVLAELGPDTEECGILDEDERAAGEREHDEEE